MPLYTIERWLAGHWVTVGASQEEADATGVFGELVSRHPDWTLRMIHVVQVQDGVKPAEKPAEVAAS